MEHLFLFRSQVHFCTLVSPLTATDYWELYQTLTPAWQRSFFGQEIRVQARQKGATQQRTN